MAAASEPIPPGRPFSHNRISKPALVLLTLSRAAYAGATVFALLMLMVVYRLWALATSQLPSGFPLGWIFDLSGRLVSPFRDTNTQVSVKETGYIEFPALVALEVFLVSTLVCVVFGYLLSFFVHIEKAPKRVPAPASARPPRPSRLRPAAALAASRSATALRGASAAGIAALHRPDWRGYRLTASERMRLCASIAASRSREAWARYVAGVKRDFAWLSRQWALYLAGAKLDAGWLVRQWALYLAGVKRDWAWLARQWGLYVAGCQRDAAWLRAKWLQATTAAAPRIRAAGASAGQLPARARSATSSTTASLGRSLEYGSSWYWGNFDAASNRFAALASRFTRSSAQPDAMEALAEATEGDGPEDQASLSRRDFLRKVMPNR